MRNTDHLLMVKPERSERIDYTDSVYPSIVRWKHHGDKIEIVEDGTHFVFCTHGSVYINGREVEENCYACVVGTSLIEGEGAALVASRLSFKGLSVFGGAVEIKGRLRYIDGCSSTVLIAPPKKGDPCFNFLHIPSSIDQTPHTHPTLRVGYIIEGNGIIKLEKDELPLQEGHFFCLPADMLHSFHTTKEHLRIVIYHPDSDVGPSDEEHPMLNRTIVDGIPAHILLRGK